MTKTVSATRASQTITFTPSSLPASAAYKSTFTVAATASSGLAVTFTSSGACSNSGATYTMTSGTGTCSVIANQAGNSNYSAAAQVTKTVTATKASQTISFTTDPPASAAYKTSFTVAATASSGLAVTFTSSGSCSDSGATYTMTASTGTCSVIANQAGNSNYSAAPPVTLTSKRDSGRADDHVHHQSSGDGGLQEQLQSGGCGRCQRECGDIHQFGVVQQFRRNLHDVQRARERAR